MIGNFVPSKANDGDPTSYWEAAPDTYPNTLTVSFGANANILSINLRLNPAPEWGPRTQTIEVLGREQSATGFATIVSATGYTFDPATGNAVRVSLAAKVADVQLRITANTGSGGGQIAEFEVFGTPAPNPDLTIPATSFSPAAPTETDDITASATVSNIAPFASDANTNVTFYVDGVKAGTAQVGPLASGANANVATKIGRRDSGTHQIVAKVDEATRIFEENEQNNSSPLAALPIAAVHSADIVSDVVWTPETPTAGEYTTFTATVRNRGTAATSGIAHPISVVISDVHSGRLAAILFGVAIGRIEPGAAARPVTLGRWRPISDGKYEVRTTLVRDGAEVPIKRDNNITRQDLYVGRGAAMPYDLYEAENGVLTGGAQVVGPNRTIGDLAGEASGRSKGPANMSTYTIDFVSLEQVAPIANPDPTRYVVPIGYSQQDVQSAVDKVRTDITGNLVGVYLPPGDYQNTGKLKIAGTAMRVIGAGPWFTRFHALAGQQNTNAGFDVAPSASGSTFSGFACFGNYTNRVDGPGKVFDLTGVSDLIFENLWVEHTVCMLWGTDVHRVTVRDSRIRNTFADAVNLTNGSTDNHVVNNAARATGDDSFALWAATDLVSGEQKNNLFEHLTAILPWRATGIAVYGGQDNTFKDIYIADTLAGTGVTVSSLSFAAPMKDFGPGPTTVRGVTVVRAGGHFFGAQTFPAVWLFSTTNKFQAVRISDTNIVDPTYSGIMFQSNYVNGRLANAIQDTKFANITISGARRSGDEFDAKSGFAVWANELPEPGQGPAAGKVTFQNLKLHDNDTDIRNLTETFTIGIS